MRHSKGGCSWNIKEGNDTKIVHQRKKKRSRRRYNQQRRITKTRNALDSRKKKIQGIRCTTEIVCIDNSGQYIYTAGLDRIMRCDTKVDRFEKSFVVSSRSGVEISLLATSSTGTYIASAQPKKPCTIIIWDTTKAHHVCKITYRNGGIDGMVFSKNRDNAIATYQNNGSRGIVRFHDFRSSSTLRCIVGRKIKDIVTADRFVFVLCERSAFVLDVRNGILRKRRVLLNNDRNPQKSFPLSVAHCDKKFFLVVSFPSKNNCIYDMGVDGREVKRKLSTSQRIFEIHGYDEEHLLLVTSSGHVTILNVKTENVLSEIKCKTSSFRYIGSGHAVDTTNGKLIRLFKNSVPLLTSFLPSSPRIDACIYIQEKNSIISEWRQHREYRELNSDRTIRSIVALDRKKIMRCTTLIASANEKDIISCYVVSSSSSSSTKKQHQEIHVYTVSDIRNVVTRFRRDDEWGSAFCCGTSIDTKVFRRVALGTRDGSVLVLFEKNGKYDIEMYISRMHACRIVSVCFDLNARYICTRDKSFDTVVSDLSKSGRSATHYSDDEEKPKWITNVNRDVTILKSCVVVYESLKR